MAVVIVTDDFSISNTDQASVKVVVTAPNMPPTVAPIATANDYTVTFAANSNDPEGDSLAYEWDFGDGSPVSTDINPTHVYNALDTYTATVTVSDGEFTVQGTATVSIFSPLNVDVYEATVDSGKKGKVKGKINLKSCFSYDGIPQQSDVIKVDFDGITLIEEPFASFEEDTKKPGKFKFKSKDIHADIDFNKSRIKVSRHKMLLNGLDNSNGADVVVSFGLSTGSDNIVMKEKHKHKGHGDHDSHDDGSSDDDHKIKWSYKEKHKDHDCDD